MSLLLNQPPRLCLGKPWLMRSSLFLSNGFSSSSLRTAPCSINGCGLNVRNITKGCRTYFAKKKVQPEEDDDDFMPKDEISWRASTGWIAIYKGDGGIVTLMNNYSTKPERRIIRLPPFVALPHCQTQIVTNVVMSSSCPDEVDCVVAVKFLGPQISFIRLAQINSGGWTNVRIENACLHFSEVTFSKKHGEFRIPGSGGHVIGSWDVHDMTHQTQPLLDTHQTQPMFDTLVFRNLPKLTKTQHELLDSCCTRTILVDSESTDDNFLVKWYRKTSGKILRTKAVMVFRINGYTQLTARYTQDIGGLCIYLSESEHCCHFPAFAPAPYSVRICDDHEFLAIDL